MTGRRRFLGGLGATALVAVPALAGCSGEEDEPAPKPRALSATEAERLAAVRFKNYDAKGARVTADIESKGTKLRLVADVDHREHRGYGLLETLGRTDAAARSLLAWSPEAVAVLEGTTARTAPRELPTTGWVTREPQRYGSDLDSTLLLLLNLAADRPDNAQLLRSSNARWVRADKVGKERVDVMTGPDPVKGEGAEKASRGAQRLTYWVSEDGLIRRLDVRLGDGAGSATIRYDQAAYRPVPSTG